MILTQEEAKAWAEILKGFSEGKEYQVPMIFDNDGNLIGIVTRGYSMVGDSPDVYAVGGGNVDFKRFGKLKNE